MVGTAEILVLRADADDGFVRRHDQRGVGDAGGCGERIGLRRNADVHGLTAQQTHADEGLLVEVKPLDADVAGPQGIETACVARAVKPDTLYTHTRAKGVFGVVKDILAGALRQGGCAGE